MKTLFIINPKAGRRKKPTRMIRRIRRIFRELHKNFEIWIWKAPEDIDGIIERAKEEGFEAIIAAGGDGTVHAIGTRLIGSDIALGIIPAGSGNGYASHLGYARRLDAAILQLHQSRRICVDTGIVAGKPFLNVCGIGIDAEVAALFSSSKSRGLKSYVQLGGKVYFNYKPFPATLTVDDEEPIKLEETLLIDVANGIFWGAGAQIAPHSSITDGLMTAVFMETTNVPSTTRVLQQLFRGTLGRNRKVRMIDGKKFVIEREVEEKGQVDGDPVGKFPKRIEIEVRPQSLYVLVPKQGEV